MEASSSARLKIRLAGPDDIPVIRALAEPCFRDTYRTILSPEQMEYMLDWMYSEESLARQMGRDGHIYYLVSTGGVPCGYFSVQPRGMQPDGVFLLELQKMYLLPEYKGRGFGRQMVDHVFRFVRESANGWPCRIELHVNRSNPSVSFHQRMGFRVLREGDFPIGHGFFMNDYIMGIDL